MKTINRFTRHNHPTKPEKREFIYMYRHEFDSISYCGWDEFAKLPVIHLLGNIARSWFGYAPSYNNCDMIWTYYKLYQTII